MFLRYLASQLGRPRGVFGDELIGRVLNRVNRRVIDLSLDDLQVHPGMRVLDVGFGGGYELAALCERVKPGEVVGVDRSQDVVARARRRFASAVADGHLDVRVADVVSMPFPDQTFERALAANTVYFWSDPVAAFRELRRVLTEDGRLVVSLRTRTKMEDLPFTRYGYTLYEPHEIERMAKRAGFSHVVVHHVDWERRLDCATITAER